MAAEPPPIVPLSDLKVTLASPGGLIIGFLVGNGGTLLTGLVCCAGVGGAAGKIANGVGGSTSSRSGRCNTTSGSSSILGPDSEFVVPGVSTLCDLLKSSDYGPD